MGCCGSQKASTEYEVTFRDGTTARFSSSAEARIAAGKDSSTGPRPAPTVKAVPIKKV